MQVYKKHSTYTNILFFNYQYFTKFPNFKNQTTYYQYIIFFKNQKSFPFLKISKITGKFIKKSLILLESPSVFTLHRFPAQES